MRRDDGNAAIPSAPIGAHSHAQEKHAKPEYTGKYVTGFVLLPKQGYAPTTKHTCNNTDPKRR